MLPPVPPSHVLSTVQAATMDILYIILSASIPLLYNLGIQNLRKPVLKNDIRNTLICLVGILWQIRHNLVGPIFMAYGSLALQYTCSEHVKAMLSDPNPFNFQPIMILIACQVISSLTSVMRRYSDLRLGQVVRSECLTRAFKAQLQMSKSDFEQSTVAKQKAKLDQNGKLDRIVATVVLEIPNRIFGQFVLLRTAATFGPAIRNAKALSLAAIAIAGLLDQQVRYYQKAFFALHAAQESIMQDGLHNQQLLATWGASLLQVAKLRDCEAKNSSLKTKYYLSHYAVHYLQVALSNNDILVAMLFAQQRLGRRELVNALYHLTNFGVSVPGLQQTWKSLEKSLTQMTDDQLLIRSQEALDSSPRVEEVPLAALHTRVDLRNVSFQLADAERTILEHVSMSIHQDRVNFLVGASGAGKSTILDLIQGVTQPTSGTVTINDEDANRIEHRPTIAARSYQMPSVLDLSVMENIRLAKPDATDAEVQSCCKLALLDEAIQNLPDGYATALSRGTPLLSGGQKQLVDSARCLLSDRPIILLDEPTANLDATKAATLMGNVRTRFQNRLVLVVTHDYSLIQQGDYVLTLKEGQVSERQDGAHAILTEDGQLEELKTSID